MKDEFYHELYEKLHSKHDYYTNDNYKTGTHYPSFFSGCLNPSGIEYETVLDIGCATGLGIKYGFEPIGKTCTGIDVSKTAVERAIARDVDAQVASVTELPFDDESFDLVCSTDLIEHLKPEDQEKAHKECFRVAKKYVAHKIANTPESRLFLGTRLHLTCWSHEEWENFFESLSLHEWKLIYKITPDVWDEIKYKIYYHKEPPEYDHWRKHNTVVVFEKING